MFALIAYGCLATVLAVAIGMTWSIAHTHLSDAPTTPKLGTVKPRYHCRAHSGQPWDSSSVTQHAHVTKRS